MNNKILIPLLLAGVGVLFLSQKKKSTSATNINTKPKNTQQFGSYDANGNFIPQQIKLIR